MGYDPAWLDRMYNNRALVPEHGVHLKRWADESARVRASVPAHLDLEYGEGPGERLDVFPAANGSAPVLVFIHGGFWRSLDKSDHSFVAPPFTARGACVVVPGYALCPGTPGKPVTVPMITLQMVRALAWTWRNIARHGGDPSRITVAGFSAGGHLAAMQLACVWKSVGADLPTDLVKNALSISGLFELDSVMHTPFLQESLQLTPADVVRASPAWMPAPPRGTLYSVVGADESPEFLRQNALIQQAWGERRVPVREAQVGRNHFTMLEALTEPAHRVHRLALRLLGL